MSHGVRSCVQVNPARAPSKERKVNKQIPDFNEVFGQLLPVAEQIQQQMQSQFQQAMGAFGQMNQLPGLQALAPIQDATMGAMQPFMNSVMGACQSTLGQIPVHSWGKFKPNTRPNCRPFLPRHLPMCPLQKQNPPYLYRLTPGFRATSALLPLIGMTTAFTNSLPRCIR